MAFTSGAFILFLSIVFLLYVPIPQSGKALFLLIASLVFYGFYALWAPVFICVFALGYFFAAKKIQSAAQPRPIVLSVVIVTTLTLYFLLRYSPLVNTLLSALTHPGGIRINIVFPLGFSYYMFKCISYVMDVYNGKIETENNFLHFLLYAAYFPEISLGPITRASDFLPQIAKKKTFKQKDMAYGFFLILWGFFKKLIFADRLAVLIAPYYASATSQSSGALWLVVCFAYFIQLYLDFSGYTDISVGISKMLGYEIKHNFNAPLIAQTISEYWRRWHISLCTWLLDYVFIPLQFHWRRLGIYASVLAALCTLTISGIWHAQPPGFILWGIIMGVCVAADALLAKRRKRWKKQMPLWLFAGASILITLAINTLMLAFTRAPSMPDAFYILGRIFAFSTWDASSIPAELNAALLLGMVVTVLSHVQEYKRAVLAERMIQMPLVLRYGAYFILLFAVILFAAQGTDIVGGFIYAQF